MKKKKKLFSNRQGISVLLACLCLLFALKGSAQVLSGFPKPKVYYSFNQGTYNYSLGGYTDHYKTGNFAGSSSLTPSPTTDRFSRAVDALFLTSQGNTTDNKAFNVFSGALFGMIPNNGTVPANFTFSCWINVPSVTDNTPRKIWSGTDFGLIYKGHDIYLRRTAKGLLDRGNYLYKFWSPASFDVPGWHQIFLVFGTRASDKTPYVKLYVGKPAYIAYDHNGPRQVAPNSSPLAWNFGGSYCFLEAGNLGAISQWSFGNQENAFKSPYVIDDFAAWDVALTENQAKQLFDCQSSSNGRDNRCWDQNPIAEQTGLANLAISRGTLSPAFATTTKNYTTQVEKEIDNIGVIPTFDAGVQVKVNGISVMNGSSLSGIPLRMGNNTIKVETTLRDGLTPSGYTINVNRGAIPEAMSATNVLTPNGDGKNDVWIIKDIELYPDNTVTVFDDRGRILYTKRGYNNDWNGTHNGSPLAEGSYSYMINFGSKQPKVRGFVTIIRNR